MNAAHSCSGIKIWNERWPMQRVAVKLNADRTRHVLILVHALLYNREKVCGVLYEQKEKAGAGFVCKHGDEWD